MKAISKKIRQTGVNLLSTIFILSTLAPLPTHAADGSADALAALLKSGGSDDICMTKYGDSIEAYAGCKKQISKSLKSSDMCETAKAAIADAEKEALEACRKSGMGTATACVEKAMTCKDEAEDSYEDDTKTGVYGFANTIQTITGQTIDTSQMSSGGSCPQYGGKDYADRKEALDDKIKQLKEELSDLSKDIAEAKSDYSKEIQRIQKEMNEAQEDLDKQKDALSAQQREELAANQKDQATMSENLESANMSKLDLEGKFTQAQIDLATELIKYSDSAVSVECLKQAQEYKASVKALYKKGSGAGGIVSSGKSVNTAAAAKAKACVQTFQKARIKIMTSGESQQKLIRAQIESTANKIANLRVQLDTASANYNSTVEAQKAAQKKAEDAVVKKMQLATQEMQSLQTKLQDDMTAINEKQKNLNQAIAAANQSLSELTSGGKPRGGTEQSVVEASATVGDQINIIDRIMEDPELAECNIPPSKYSDKKRTSSTGSRTRDKAKGTEKKSGVQ